MLPNPMWLVGCGNMAGSMVQGWKLAGADFSGTASWCTSNRYPLGDWRDYDQISVNLGAPGQGSAR